MNHQLTILASHKSLPLSEDVPGSPIEYVQANEAREVISRLEQELALAQRDSDSAIIQAAKRQLEAEHGSLLTIIPTGTLEQIKQEALKPLEIEIEHLKEALKFYADPHQYGIGGGSSNNILCDAGKVAKQALRRQK